MNLKAIYGHNMKSNVFMISRLPFSILFLALGSLLVACSNTTQTPSVVKVVKQDNQYSVTVNGQPYDVRGVGLGYKNDENVIALKEAGGNTFRTWDVNHIEQELAMAQKLGLMIAVGIPTGKELLGFETEISMEEGLKAVVADVVKNPDMY